jgi:hypothetical protein
MVNIDTVYQKVLAITNKEQRGYITPHEFNLFADQAQMEIFEQYFYDLNQFSRAPNNDMDYANITSNLQDKISLFEMYNEGVDTVNEFGDIDLSAVENLYRLGTVRVKYKNQTQAHVAEEIQIKEHDLYTNSRIARYTEQWPVYFSRVRKASSISYPSFIKIIPNPNTENGDWVKISYIKKPLKPSWGYIVVNDKPLYNSQTSTNFDLHESEESELVYRILVLFGINLKQPQLGQSAAALEANKVQQEKQ